MAKIAVMPGQDIIGMMGGVIDYYVHDGVPCARKWPRSPGHDRAPAVMAAWDAFTIATQLWNQLSPAIKEAYNQMAVGTNMTGRDIFMKSYINKATLGIMGWE